MKLKKVCDIEYDDELDVIILVDFDQSTWIRNDLLAAVTAERDALREALKPFAHDDLRKLLQGQGLPESIVYQRNNATLRIRDFQNARAALDKDA